MPVRRLVLLAASLFLAARPAAAQPLGDFAGHATVGGAGAGTATYDASAGAYEVTAPGGAARHLAWRRLDGDFVLRARAAWAAPGGAGRAMGWAVRSGLGADAAYVEAAVDGDGRATLVYRRAPGEPVRTVRVGVDGADVIQLAREDGVYAVYAARFGEPFERVELGGVDLGDAVYAGLFAAGEGGARARFQDVQFTLPAGEAWATDRTYLGSRLEILDVETGEREVVHTTPGSIQAPNWTVDGQALIYNGDGLLYRFDLATRTPAVIDTDFAVRNNNDHVLSFDGRLLGISHHPDEHDRQSIIYVVPVEGGVPRKVTDQGPSYLHGWSPDGRHLVYTARREADHFDVYRIPVAGGPEERLTDAPGLDDGPEYSPDGRWIYFNSERTGTMQLWRMRPDGTGAEQLTHDELNDWFPHVSPDGRHVLFLSFGTDVDPGDHPFYKHVYLRLMPADGGTPRVVAYLYGGQGTINVPSWAPDSRRAAFVSNTGPLGDE